MKKNKIICGLILAIVLFGTTFYFFQVNEERSDDTQFKANLKELTFAADKIEQIETFMSIESREVAGLTSMDMIPTQ
jgi:hypothetical protein